MTPAEFIKKWKGSERLEREAAQSQFIDLCHLLDEPTPADGDREHYGFEKGVTKTGGGDGGGRIVAAGTPEDVARVKESYTGAYLRELLGRRAALRSSEGTEDVNRQRQKSGGKKQAAE